MARPDHHLVSVTPEIKAHPLWDGSNEQLYFKYGGLTYGVIRKMIAYKESCTDLTAREREWLRLWKEQIKK